MEKFKIDHTEADSLIFYKQEPLIGKSGYYRFNNVDVKMSDDFKDKFGEMSQSLADDIYWDLRATFPYEEDMDMISKYQKFSYNGIMIDVKLYYEEDVLILDFDLEKNEIRKEVLHMKHKILKAVSLYSEDTYIFECTIENIVSFLKKHKNTYEMYDEINQYLFTVSRGLKIERMVDEETDFVHAIKAAYSDIEKTEVDYLQAFTDDISTGEYLMMYKQDNPNPIDDFNFDKAKFVVSDNFKQIYADKAKHIQSNIIWLLYTEYQMKKLKADSFQKFKMGDRLIYVRIHRVRDETILYLKTDEDMDIKVQLL